MTVTYSLDVAKARFCGFAKLLTRWKGSIYKILWKEFFVFCAGYTVVSITYRLFLNACQKREFEKFVLFVDSVTDLIPLSFVLGFYVSLVIGRWWAQYDAIPWPDKLCLMIASYVHGADERSRMIRRTLGRYLILLQALTFQAVSTQVKKRFPTTQHLVAAGIMTKEEQSVYDQIPFPYGKWWVPCQWFSSLLMRAKKEGRIKDSILLDALFRELLLYRTSCGTMLNYDWISVPLVYTQVVTLATYIYAIALIVGRQYLDTTAGYAKHQIDLYVPLFTVMQFFFYLGWLKVAEQIVNPYGEDDDDFELNWCLDRTVNVVYLIVDHLQTKHPKIRKDCFWDETEPRLPQTKHSAKGVGHMQMGSAFNLEVEEAEYLPMDSFLEEDKEENMYAGDSVRQTTMNGFRSSFIMKMLYPKFQHQQSFGKKSIQMDEVVKNSLQLRGYNNAAFVKENGNDKSCLSTPALSRKSSFRSFVKSKPSPSQSRASSISLRPNSARPKHQDQVDSDKMTPVNGTGQDTSSETQESGQIRSKDQRFTENLEENVAELDSGALKLEISMPPIPEEPHPRISTFVSVDCEDTGQELGQGFPAETSEDVQTFVKEASEVLKELNRTISAQGHKQNCELKGYESCCSFSSDVSSEDDSDDLSDAKEKSYRSTDLREVLYDNVSLNV